MKPTKEYVCDYYHDGSWWGLNIHAYNIEDAEARCKKLGNLRLQGELILSMPAYPCTGSLLKAVCAIRNFFSQSKPK